MRYFELEFDNNPRSRDTDSDLTGQESICILAEREPTYQEAEKFCESDMKKFGYQYVVSINELTKEEAENFYDMEDAVNRFPVFR